MIGVDTNVLVRYVVEDDAEQTAKVHALVERLTRDGERLFVPQVVVCELVWVLATAYGFPRAAIADAVAALLDARQLDFEARSSVARALDAYAAGSGDYADYLIVERAAAAGCHEVVSFDRALAKEGLAASP